jgi:hypothetical protein
MCYYSRDWIGTRKHWFNRVADAIVITQQPTHVHTHMSHHQSAAAPHRTSFSSYMESMTTQVYRRMLRASRHRPGVPWHILQVQHTQLLWLPGAVLELHHFLEQAVLLAQVVYFDF